MRPGREDQLDIDAGGGELAGGLRQRTGLVGQGNPDDLEFQRFDSCHTHGCGDIDRPSSCRTVRLLLITPTLKGTVPSRAHFGAFRLLAYLAKDC